MSGKLDILACALGAKVSLRPPVFKRILVLAPHPDDEVLGCGGYLAWSLANGSDVTVLFVTDGRVMPGSEETRLQEARRALGVLGIDRWECWSLRDGGLDDEVLPADRLQELIERVRAEVVLVPHPREAHADHAAVANLPRRLKPVPGLAIMTYEVWTPLEPDCVVNVSDQMGRKLEAIRSYQSQCRRYNLERLASGLAAYRAAWSRMRSWEYAEAFGLCRHGEYGDRQDAH